MFVMDSQGSSRLTRRTLLSASAGALTIPTVTGQTATGTGRTAVGAVPRRFGRCPDATLRPSMGHCEGTNMDGCSDDHSETQALQEAVRETLETRYPTVGALIDDGFLPYFDTLDRDEDGYSHWLSPDHVADDGILDPERPESVLVDDERWVPIGVMFVATRDGEPVDPPPAVYEGKAADSDDEVDGDRDDDYDHGHGDHDDDHGDGDENRCSPWHYHAGLPGRFAWWYFQEVYADEHADGSRRLPCQTPCVMHVWTVDHPEGVYAHGGPPDEYREGAVATETGFETDADPSEDRLGWSVLPDDLRPDRLPDEFDVP